MQEGTRNKREKEREEGKKKNSRGREKRDGCRFRDK